MEYNKKIIKMWLMLAEAMICSRHTGDKSAEA